MKVNNMSFCVDQRKCGFSKNSEEIIHVVVIMRLVEKNLT